MRRVGPKVRPHVHHVHGFKQMLNRFIDLYSATSWKLQPHETSSNVNVQSNPFTLHTSHRSSNIFNLQSVYSSNIEYSARVYTLRRDTGGTLEGHRSAHTIWAALYQNLFHWISIEYRYRSIAEEVTHKANEDRRKMQVRTRTYSTSINLLFNEDRRKMQVGVLVRTRRQIMRRNMFTLINDHSYVTPLRP